MHSTCLTEKPAAVTMLLEQQPGAADVVHCLSCACVCCCFGAAAANKGIGYEIARLLAEQGMTVVVTSRNGGGTGH
jgi:hypothetical protein